MLDDLQLLASWQSQPHVAEWWDANAPYDESDLSDARVSRCIVLFEGRPFAFMQDYTVHGWEDHHFANLPTGSRGIDQFIGDPDMIDQGHGTSFIKARMKSLFEVGAPVIATDPHPENARAIYVYRKLGFAPSGTQQETKWGIIQPMIAKR